MMRNPGRRSLRVTTLLAASALLAGLSIVEAGRAQPGDSDETFSRDGLTTIGSFESSTEYATASDVAVGPDGKIVVVGSTGEIGEDFVPGVAVARLNADGSPDESFGTRGKLVLAGTEGGGRAVAVQPDGRILIAVGAGAADVVRLEPDGDLDPTFSGDGLLLATAPGIEDVEFGDIALSADGRIVLVGEAVGTDVRDFAAARYLTDGTPDPTFSGDGIAVDDLGAADIGRKLALGPDGTIVAGGVSYTEGPTRFRLALARYTPAGALDPAFSGDGFTLLDQFREATGVALDPAGRIGVSALGRPDAGFLALGFDSSGELDPAFGAGGVANTKFDGRSFATDIAATPGDTFSMVGRNVRGSERWVEDDFALARFGPDGELDRSFSGDGRATADLQCGQEGADAMAVDAAGRILAAGDCAYGAFGTTASIFGIARFETSPGPADADGDGISDSRDRCPAAFERRGKGCPVVDRRIASLDFSRREVDGIVQADDGGCEFEQRVLLYRVAAGRGQDQLVGRGRTDPNDFVLRLPKGSGGDAKFYVVAKPSTERDGGICKRARSRPKSA